MSIDTVAISLIIVGTSAWLAKSAFQYVSNFRTRSCANCHACGVSSDQNTADMPIANVLVNISNRARTKKKD